MKLIYQIPNPSGAYPPIQNCSVHTIPANMAVWPDTLGTEDFYAYNGFVTLDVEDVDGVPTVTACTPNTAAWEEWKAGLPEDTGEESAPTAQDDTDAMLIDHEYRLTLLELGVTE